jgi:hypothetical protein
MHCVRDIADLDHRSHVKGIETCASHVNACPGAVYRDSLRTLTSTLTKPRRSIRAQCADREEFTFVVFKSIIFGNRTGNHRRDMSSS